MRASPDPGKSRAAPPREKRRVQPYDQHGRRGRAPDARVERHGVRGIWAPRVSAEPSHGLKACESQCRGAWVRGYRALGVDGVYAGAEGGGAEEGRGEGADGTTGPGGGCGGSVFVPYEGPQCDGGDC